MNTATGHEASYNNMADNERAFRTVLGMTLVTKIIIGAIASPAAMFTLAAMSIYLVITAIIGSDPFYAVAKSLIKRNATQHNPLLAS